MNGFRMSSPPPFSRSMASSMPFAGNPGTHPVMMHPHHRPQYHGFCHSCCHPMPLCCCSHRQCRKEAKELLVTPQAKVTTDHAGVSAYVVADKSAMGTDVFASTFSELMGFMKVSEPTEGKTDSEENEDENSDSNAARLTVSAASGLRSTTQPAAGIATAFIGGGCCVYLSIEYMSTNTNSMVIVLVLDSEGTILAWAKNKIQPGYYIKEGIISTNPGAILGVSVINVVARVRWCEVFSC